MPPLSPALNVMVAAARKAARSLVRDFGEVENLQVSVKGPADFVSAADLRSEDILKTELARARPGYGFLLEERGAIEGTDPSHRFVIDPLDGTTNFLHGVPHFAISIALEREGDVVAGVVYNPVRDELFLAERGRGAYLNDRRLRVSARGDLETALLATGIPARGWPGHERSLRELAAAMAATSGVRRYGTASLDLAYIASGRFDAYWERNLKAWDVAAGALLVREAGGNVTAIEGTPFDIAGGSVLATNGKLHKSAVALFEPPTSGHTTTTAC
ncbi:MAG: inositol monophosphatase [Alphaproteobacteria bacterium]|nr:inositol monophosphatase [Alphaproteobacteria bacterium]